jgi:hypothetical protein
MLLTYENLESCNEEYIKSVGELLQSPLSGEELKSAVQKLILYNMKCHCGIADMLPNWPSDIPPAGHIIFQFFDILKKYLVVPLKIYVSHHRHYMTIDYNEETLALESASYFDGPFTKYRSATARVCHTFPWGRYAPMLNLNSNESTAQSHDTVTRDFDLSAPDSVPQVLAYAESILEIILKNAHP